MNSQSSITYCDEFDASDGFIEETCTKNAEERNRLKAKFLLVRHSLFSPADNESKASQPKVLIPDYQLFDKENLPPAMENENAFIESIREVSEESKARRKKPLRDLSSQTKSQSQEESAQEKQPKSNQKKARKSNKLWQGCIFDDNVISEMCANKKADTGRKSCPGKESASPEYGQESKVKIKLRKTIHATGESRKRKEVGTEGEFSDAKHCVASSKSRRKSGPPPGAECDREDGKAWDKMSDHSNFIFPNVEATSLNSEGRVTKSPSLEITTDSFLGRVESNQVANKGDDLKNLEMKSINNYRKNFSAEKFLKNIPDPWSYFGDRNRLCESYSDHSLHYLKMKFRKHYAQTLSDALMFHNYNLYLAYKYLMKKNRGVKLRSANRPLSECNANRPTTVNEQFQQEVAFIENEEQVRNHVKNQKAARKQRLKEAVRQGTLKECGRCCGTEFLPEETVECPEGHTFCKECIMKHVEMEVKNGKLQFDCLSQCNQKYSIEIIQNLNPELFTKISEISKPLDLNSPVVRDSA